MEFGELWLLMGYLALYTIPDSLSWYNMGLANLGFYNEPSGYHLT